MWTNIVTIALGVFIADMLREALRVGTHFYLNRRLKTLMRTLGQSTIPAMIFPPTYHSGSNDPKDLN